MMHRKTITFTTLTLFVLGQHFCPVRAQENTSAPLTSDIPRLPVTTASPVVRGAFVMARLLGQPPEPPPPNIPAVEPNVRGATTIREQLDKHRADASCAGCHAKMDPPGFALESFDVIGGLRTLLHELVQSALFQTK